MAQDELRSEAGFVEKVRRMDARLDHDDLFARSLQGRPVVLGYYFTSDRDGRNTGVLPEPVMAQGRLRREQTRITAWTRAAMSAIMNANPWNSAMGRPNCRRSRA